MKRVILLLAVPVVASLALAACSPASAHRSTPGVRVATRATPSPGASTSPLTAPPPSAPATVVAGYPTDQQAADAAARESGQPICASQYPGQARLTTPEVSVYLYNTGPCAPGGHAAMDVYVYRDAGGWHLYTWEVAQEGMPDGSWGTPVSLPPAGCVNVRQAPSLTAAVVTCLGASSIVLPAGSDHSPWYPPVWADGKIWWYVFQPVTPPYSMPARGNALGWVALEFLTCGTHDPEVSC